MIGTRHTTAFISRRLQRPLALATACYVVVLVAATHYPRPQEILERFGGNAPTDKTMHVVAYGVLGLLAAATLAAWGHWRLRNVFLVMVALALFGALDEATQPFFDRLADPLDWVGDCVGIVGGVLAVAVWIAARGWSRPTE